MKMTMREYEQACDEYMGICTACKELQDSVEPDAEGYECDGCGEHAVMGVEQALLTGNVLV
jgi:rRNA maturation endonuclease Nob1